jgi:hypothetical protein
MGDFSTAGYYIVCLRSGESLEKRYGSPAKAYQDMMESKMRLCQCKRCAGFYLEEDFGLTDK